MKRLALILLTLALVAVSVFAITSCDKDKNKECEHDYVLQTEGTTPATCKAEGLGTYKCSKCNATKQEALPKTDEHTYGTVREVVTAATCTTAGSKAIRCTVCGAIQPGTEAVIDALGHDWGEYAFTTAPTCLTGGEKARSCARCQTSEKETVAALGHNFAPASVNPTGASLNQIFFVTTKSEWEDELSSKALHEVSTGEGDQTMRYAKFSVHNSAFVRMQADRTGGAGCDFYSKAITLAADDTTVILTASFLHSPPSAGKTVTAYSWFSFGFSKAEEGTTVGLFGFDGDGNLIELYSRSTLATCKSMDGGGDGAYASVAAIVDIATKKVSFYVNGALITEKVIEALPDTAADYAFVKGYLANDSVRDKDNGNYVRLDDLGVFSGKLLSNKGVTEVLEKIKESKNKIELATLFEGDYETTATCTAGGRYYYVCTNEGCTEQVDKGESPALGHDFVKVDADCVAPTCLVDGSDAYKCSRCPETKSETVAALGHDWDVWNTDTEPTCLVAGTKHRNCKREGCDGVDNGTIDALGHAWAIPDEKHTNTLTKVISYQTAEEWAAADIFADGGSGNRMQVLAKGVDIKLRGTNNYGSYGGTFKILDMDLASYATAKQFVFTVSLQHTTSSRIGFGIKVYDAAGDGYWLFDLHFGGALYKFDEGQDADNNTPIADGTAFDKQWGDLIVTLNLETKTCVYYLNGVKIAEAVNADLPDSIVSATFGRGKVNKDANTLVDNLCVYVGEINHIALDAVVAAVNMQETAPALLPLDAGEAFVDVAPTCTEAGEQSIHCSRTGCTARSAITPISPLGHDWGEWQPVGEGASCTTSGEKQRTCKRENCNAVDGPVNDGEPLGHAWGTYVQTLAPTCMTVGSETAPCTRQGCEASDTREVAKLPHTYGDYTTTLNPTCTAAGSHYRTCTAEGCGDVDVEEIKALGHIFEQHTDDTLTKVISYQTTEEWAAADILANGGSGNRMELKSRGVDIKLRGTNNYGSYGGTFKILDMNLADYAATKQFVFTVSFKSITAGNKIGFGIKVYDANDEGYWLFDLHFDGPLYKFSEGQDAGAIAIADGSAFDQKWGDLVVTLDLETKTCVYYINGVKICEAVNTSLPDSIVSATFGRGKVNKDAQFLVDNLCVYTGKANHLALDKLFADVNNSETTLSPLPLEADDYTVDTAATCTTAGQRSLYCIRPGCGGTLIPDTTEVIPALGHDMGAWVVTAWPTDSVAGSKTRSCKNAGCTHSETVEIAIGDTMTEVYAFRTYDDWTAEAKKSGAISLAPEAVDTTNGFLRFSFDGTNEHVSKSTAGFKLDLTGAGIASGSDLVLTYSLYAEPGAAAGCFPIWVNRAVKSDGGGVAILGIETSTKAGSWVDGNLAEWENDTLVAESSSYIGKWVNVAMVIHNSTKTVDYYINGVKSISYTFATKDKAQLPEDLSTLTSFVAYENNYYKAAEGPITFYIDNYALYQGTYSDAAGTAIFAANSNDFTVNLNPVE